MYIYFQLSNTVLTCDEYPQIMSVEIMKLNNLEYMCDKWEKNDTDDGTFTLSYKHYLKKECNCNYTYNRDDYDTDVCFGCTNRTSTIFKVGEDLYLQNSGSMDIVCVNPNSRYCQMCEVDNYPHIYKWINRSYLELIFALHIKDDMLSDEDISEKINVMKESCCIIFTNCL